MQQAERSSSPRVVGGEEAIPRSGPGARPIGAYALIVAAFGLGHLLASRFGQFPRLQPVDVLVLSLSTFRFGRVVADDLVARPIRAPFVESQVVDLGGGRQTIEELPAGSGLRVAIGQLLKCRTCIAFWGAAFQVWGLMLAPGLMRPFAWLMAASGGGEILEALARRWERSGQ